MKMSTKEISIDRIYEIFGHANYISLDGISKEERNRHPDSGTSPNNLDSYIERVKAKCHKYELEIGEHKHVYIKPNPGKKHIDETGSTYHTKYKITVRNLIINVDPSHINMFFDDLLSDKEYYPPESKLSSDAYNCGIYLVFEDNQFVSTDSNKNAYFQFLLGKNTYLIFQENTFKSVDMYLTIGENSVAEITRNHFENNHITIGGKGAGIGYENPHGYYSSTKAAAADHMEEKVNEPRRKFVQNIENKFKIECAKNGPKNEEEKFSIKDILAMLLYMDKKIKINPDDVEMPKVKSLVRLTDNTINKLAAFINIFCFRGVNTISHLELHESITRLYWGPYQNIDPKGNYPYINRKVFLDFIERAVKDNDKIQEARLRREFLKCERVIAWKESQKHSWQDIFILECSRWISDYGISWIRPFLMLLSFNATLAAVVIVCFCEPQYYVSWCLFFDKWSLLFVELFNPLSSLSDVEGIKNSGGIASINFVQKVILAIFYYEIIKIFRRFSK